MFVCAFWALMLFQDGRTNGDHAKKTLCVFMCVATLLYLGHGFYFYRNLGVLPFTDTMYAFCNLAVFPLYYIYIEELAEGHRNRWRRVAYLLPAILTSVVVAVLYVQMSHEEALLFIRNYLYHQEAGVSTRLIHMQASVHTIAKFIFALQIVPVLFLGIRKISRYNRQVCSYYADTEDKTLTPFSNMLIFFFIISCISFFFNIIGRYRFSDSTSLLAIPSFTFSMLLFCLGYVGYKQCFNVANLEMEMGGQISTNPLENGGGGNFNAHIYPATLSDTDAEEGKEPENMVVRSRRKWASMRIVTAIRDEHLFLRPNLKISDISSIFHTNRDYIYHAINVEMGVSFSDFINQQRVEYAQQVMKEHPDKLLYEVATESGFSSNATFYRCFKQFTGCSPKEYKEYLR